MTSAADTTRTTPTIERKPFWSKTLWKGRATDYFLLVSILMVVLSFGFLIGDSDGCTVEPHRGYLAEEYNEQLRSQAFDYHTCVSHTHDRTACWIAVYSSRKP